MNELIPINSSNEELEEKLMQETDVENIKEIINIFNLNIKKKDVIRVAKLNQLQDKVYEQMDRRITNKGDEFSNADLITYFKTIQETVNKSDMSLDNVDTPSIQIIQNQLNVTETPVLNRDSRQKISDAVQRILRAAKEKNVQNQTETTEYEQLTLDLGEPVDD